MKIDRAIDILDKWEFFYGQRAGRELWAGKPTFYNFFCYGRFDVHGEEVITHWKPLPEPPEEVQGNE